MRRSWREWKRGSESGHGKGEVKEGGTGKLKEGMERGKRESPASLR